MAGSLRELIATFGIRYDPSGAKKANSALSGLENHALKAGSKLDQAGKVGGQKLATGVAQGAQDAAKGTNVLVDALKGLGFLYAAREVGRGFMYMVKSASDADETLNVLQASFGASAKSVTDFANKTAAEVGRSEYVLRDFAGRIGALVSPAFASMGDAGQEQSARISNDFSKLAIDLASFFNKSEEDSIIALRSGISGESEPLKQFGVNLTEQGIADSLGINAKQFRAMNRAEKTMARYRAIMIQTKNAQGDAARTADGFANLSRALGSAILDTATTIGRKMLPGVESLTRYLRDGVRWIGKVAKQSKVLESAFIVLTGAAVGFGAKAAWAGRQTIKAWARALWPLALAIVVIDEIWTTLAGGDSVLRDLITWFTGSEEATDAWLTSFKEGAVAAWDALVAGVQRGWEYLTTFFSSWMDGFEEIMNSGFVQWFSNTFSAIGEYLGAFWGGVIDLWKSAIGAYFGWIWDQYTRIFKAIGDAAWSVLPDFMKNGIKSGVESVSNAYDAVKDTVGMAAAGAGLSADEVNRRVDSNIRQGAASNTQTVNVNVNGGNGSPRDIGNETQRAVRKALQEDRRKVNNAMGGR